MSGNRYPNTSETEKIGEYRNDRRRQKGSARKLQRRWGLLALPRRVIAVWKRTVHGHRVDWPTSGKGRDDRILVLQSPGQGVAKFPGQAGWREISRCAQLSRRLARARSSQGHISKIRTTPKQIGPATLPPRRARTSKANPHKTVSLRAKYEERWSRTNRFPRRTTGNFRLAELPIAANSIFIASLPFLLTRASFREGRRLTY